MGICNKCSLDTIKREMKPGEMITIINSGGELGGKDVFVHPEDVFIEKKAKETDHPQHMYWRCWFMEIPEKCLC